MVEFEPHSLEEIGHALNRALRTGRLVRDEKTVNLLSAIEPALPRIGSSGSSGIVRVTDREAKITHPQRGF